jgi:hypothetical protein
MTVLVVNFHLTSLIIILNHSFFFFYLEYQRSVQDARQIKCLDKSLFCLNFYYVFYAEIEINLNRFFTENLLERWSLLFVDYNFMPPIYDYDINIDINNSAQLFTFQPNILTILHNAKIKYCCLKCHYEWTSARGRVIFQAERPEMNKYNILFAYLFTQKCQICRQETEPSWYLDEVTRVMKSVCGILTDKFYSDRQFSLPSSPTSSSEKEYVQRSSDMRNHHHEDLCRACQEGSCYPSRRQYQWRR